ncbi:hypothetical protein BEWA_033300 [Theileria equi strain WA]|uniref:Small ribosomal subunit protein mS29 n=1 Tax=Theileria equi strain WA TaxID=1537102 RepID=L0AY18_THEEQ|nr:hypothetical protein BEWA_033300 [Theileria equi strain WA]AFZ80477.1 hypothetical protein BEWA_033300 [Theileria equi strain WA]|eukprot:XP_004830143.1 hypothetical protein BEWA_033300 [Theileria equi strain WA]
MVLKVVFLHGLMQNAEAFRTQTAKFGELFSKYLNITYLDAPHLLTEHPAFIVQVNENKTDEEIRVMEDEFRERHYKRHGRSDDYGRTWYYIETRGKYSQRLKNVEVIGLDESLNMVIEECKKANADGIMGFSQGAIIASVVAKQTLLNQNYGWKPRFCVLFSGPMPNCLPVKNLLNTGSPIAVPSLHILGTNDKIVPNNRSIPLAGCYSDPIIHYHDGTHTVPDNDLGVLETFLGKIIAQIPGSGAGRKRSHLLRSKAGLGESYESANVLLKTVYKLTEESYRKYGVTQGVLPDHLLNPNSFLLDESSIYTDFNNCNIYNIGSIVQLDTNDVFNTLPEGLCGDATKDIVLLPEGQPLGIVNRKQSVELISQLKQYSSSGTNTIKSRGVLLDGKRGSGKSYILNHVSLWARNNGWMVIIEPSPSKYAKEVGTIKRSNAGVYIQLEFAKAFLERLILSNKTYLSEIPVIQSLYGRVSLDGNYVNYSKRSFDPVIENIIKEELEILKEESQPDEIECAKETLKLWDCYRRQFKIPILKERLENPKTLLDIAEFGVNNETFANQAVYEIFDQLKHQTKFPLLIVVDEFNECFPVSEYLSIKYEGTKFGGWIPSYHLSMPRLFYKFDGDQFKNGYKLLATSWTRNPRRNYKPEYLGIMPNELRTVRNFTPKEYANYIHHLQNTQVIFNFPNDKTNYYYMLTGGNGFESRRLLSKLY